MEQEDKGDAYVNAGSLESFVSNLSGNEKQDVLGSSLLAQLAASKQHDRYKDAENWFKFYVNAMENLGWVIQSFKFNEYNASHASFSLSQGTLGILNVMVGGEKVVVDAVKATLDGLAKATDGPKLLDSKAVSGKNGNFQIMPCTLDPSGQITVGFMGFFFRAQHYKGDFFFFTWNSEDIKLFYAHKVCTLNEEAYAAVRQDIIEKLGDRRKTFFKHLDF